jgi:hypothetical protein
VAPFGETLQIALADHVDAVRTGCRVGAPDAARSLELDERSDVLVVQTGSDGDRGATLIAEAPCSDADRLVCRRASTWPVRAVARGVGPGSVRAVVETVQGNPTTLTAFRRRASATVLVPRGDDCSDAFEIPETGGRFEGNTQNAYADFDASCDYGGQPAGGAPISCRFRTQPAAPHGCSIYSGATTIRCSSCETLRAAPGEFFGTYSPGYAASRSFIDVNLEAGSYALQIDGYNGASGAWSLEVFSAEL